MDALNQGAAPGTDPAMTPQQRRLSSASGGSLALYREYAIGGGSWADLVLYELLLTTLCNLPGILGLGLRRLLFPWLFSESRGGVVFGRGLVLRGTKHIRLGAKTLVDDFVTLDARDGGRLDIADHVSIGRFSIIAAKGGQVQLGAGVNIGTNCRIATQSTVEIGESTLIAAFVYIGPGNHQVGDGDVPLIERPMDIRGGVKIGAHAWIGARATILDGVTIGEGAIIGAHSLVRDDVPAGTIVAGTPARVVGTADKKCVTKES